MFSMHLTIAFVVVLSSSLLYLSYPPCDTHHWLTFPVSFFGTVAPSLLLLENALIDCL